MSETPLYNDVENMARMSAPIMPKAGLDRVGSGAPVLVALDQHDAEVANLADEIHILLDKIGPVTGPERPEMADKSPGEIEVATSQVADRINTSSRTLSNLRNTIRSVRERVEL